MTITTYWISQVLIIYLMDTLSICWFPVKDIWNNHCHSSYSLIFCYQRRKMSVKLFKLKKESCSDSTLAMSTYLRLESLAGNGQKYHKTSPITPSLETTTSVGILAGRRALSSAMCRRKKENSVLSELVVKIRILYTS